MTVREMIGKVMAALDEADNEILEKNVGDYENKIYTVIDSVQRELAAALEDIEKSAVLTVTGGEAALPEDCFTVQYLSREEDWVYGKTVYGEDGACSIRYTAYPTPITRQTDPDGELEISKQAQEAMVYGVCAGLCINDEPDLYPVYLERYQSMASAILRQRQETTRGRIVGGVTF